MNETATTTRMLAHLRQWLVRTRPDPAPDAALLRRFLRTRDEAAFAALVDRHGPMVLGTARRIVGDYHLAEDVFQAAFLTLARRAANLRRPAALPAWLHQTTCNLARSALRARQRRRRAETEAVNRGSDNPLDEPSSSEQLALLDEELSRLPERYRLPVVLCCLEGRTQEEAAALLGWTPGSVRGRLERGRRRLKERLIRRGLTLAVAAGAALALERPLLADSLRGAALRCASRLNEDASPLALALADAVRPSAFTAGWRAILVVALVGLTGIGLASLARSPEPPSSADDKPPAPKAELDGDPLPQGAVARLGSSHLRIGNGAFALTPDEKAIVTVTPQGVVRRFDAKTGRLLERREITDRGDADPVGQATAQLSEDGTVVAIAEPYRGGRRVTVWDVANGERIFRRASTENRSLSFGSLSPDGRLLAFLEYENDPDYKQALRIFDVKTGRMREIGKVEYNVYGVRFSADGRRAVLSQTSSKNGDSTLACFDVAAGQELWRLPRKGIDYTFSPDGKTVLLGGMDQRSMQIIQTDPASGKPTENVAPCDKAHPNDRMIIAPDNRTVAISHFGEIVLWDLHTHKEIRRITPPKTNGRGYGPELGAISLDSRALITNLGHLQRWDLTTGKPFFAPPPEDSLGGPIERIAFMPDGKEVFASSWYLNSGRWNLASGELLGLTPFKRIHQLTQTPNGLREVAIDSHKTPYEATVSDPLAGKVLDTVRWTDPKEVGINGLRAYMLTADGKTLLTIHGDEPQVERQRNYVTACDVASGRRLTRFSVPGNAYYPRSPFSPCGRRAVLGGKVYHVGTGTELFVPAGEPGERLVPSDRQAHGPVWFSADSRLLAGFLRKEGEKSAANDTLTVWELASGRVLARFPKAGFVAQVAFAPDGRTLARLDGRGVYLDDLLTGERLAEFAASDVTCDLTDRGCATQTLVFAPDGRTLATGHQDGTILLWKVPQPREDRRPAPAEAERDALWADLGDPSPIKARTAIERLLRHPTAAGALLTARFRAPTTADDPALAALVKDLDSDVFATREEAARKLRGYGAKAEAALRRELAGAPSLEMKRRAESVLIALPQPVLRLPLTGEDLRGLRAIEVLERLSDAGAGELLQAWAEQTDNGRLAAEARVAVRQLRRTRELSH
jgi:RNA polymerase sigma factor (sigma-70 family)